MPRELQAAYKDLLVVLAVLIVHEVPRFRRARPELLINFSPPQYGGIDTALSKFG